MKKRFFSLMLCIALVFTMSASAFAADITEASTTVTKNGRGPTGAGCRLKRRAIE